MTNVKDSAAEPYEPLTVLIEPFIKSKRDSLPEILQKRVDAAYWPAPEYWDDHSEEQRRKQIEAFDYKNNPAREVERVADDWDYALDANTWWLTESIAPVNAAVLLSGRNPNTQTFEDAMRCTNLEMGPQDLQRLRNTFEGASASVARTLKDWTEYALQRGVKIHSWVGEWQAWVGEVDARRPAAAQTDTAAPVAEPRAAVGLPDAPVVQAPAGEPKIPDALPTRDIAELFDGLPYSSANWPKRLSGTLWVQSAMAGRGEVGGVTGLWWPLKLAQLVCDQAKQNEKAGTFKAFNSRFKKNPALSPWRDGWSDYYDTFSDTDDSESNSGN